MSNSGRSKSSSSGTECSLHRREGFIVFCTALLGIFALSRSLDALGQHLEIRSQPEIAYPSWFARPPVGGGLWAVGYARTYATWSTSVAEARNDAYQRLRHRWGARFVADRLYQATPGQALAFRGAKQDMRPLRDTLHHVSYVDSAQVGRLTLVLAHVPIDDASASVDTAHISLQGLRMSSRRSSRQSFAGPEPSWVSTRHSAAPHGRLDEGKETSSFPQKGGGAAPRIPQTARAVGMSSKQYHMAGCWAGAERHAYWSLAAQTASRLDRLRKTDGHGSHVVTRVQAAATIRQARLVARWQDEDACFILVEAAVIPETPAWRDQ